MGAGALGIFKNINYTVFDNAEPHRKRQILRNQNFQRYGRSFFTTF